MALQPGDYTEDSLVEQPAIETLAALGWETLDCYEEVFGSDLAPQSGSIGKGPDLGRAGSHEVVLLSRLRPALARLNPGLPEQALDLAVQELLRDRSLASPAQGNRQVCDLLKEGVKITFRDPEGLEKVETVRVVDWERPENNDFFLASQFWVSGELHKRRPDLVGFVNGLPLLLVEFKAPHVGVKHAFDDNLRDYKDAIPHLFWYNALVLLSNGSEAVLGTLTSPWEHFSEWKKINSEGEEGRVSLETTLRAVCQPERLLDLVENFTLFVEAKGGLKKLVARNHQYLGVNNAYDNVRRLLEAPLPAEEQGSTPLGVFWHTQGSGKSYSMIFFAQKVLRKVPGNWTFAIVTDRVDLDDQIYKNFAGAGAVIEAEERVRAQSGEHLKRLLREDHRYVFTLIQKFHTEKGEVYPALSERSDIIVMTDEAHRTQYDVLALNMRNALPNAAFIGFTGTPLIKGEERTRQVFGDYVSIYNFKQSVDDEATVPLYYENRIPELQLTNEYFKEEMDQLLEEAMLDEAQERRVEREFSREYHLITREDRLEAIAEDLVLHFMGRGFQGKAMVVGIDKATALRMYDKVQKYWRMHRSYLQAELETCDPLDRPELEDKLRYMRATDMAVVISQAQNEIDDMRQFGLDIAPHRRRMIEEDLDTKFKDPDDPLRVVFVCAMWMTGFDVPSCSTIYLDKPMRNHTLMQTIARANRVFRDKVNGLIVDYIGVFRDLQRALAIYGSASQGGVEEGELPVETKAALVDELDQAIQETREFLGEHGVSLDAIHQAEGFDRTKLLDDAVDALLVDDETRNAYLNRASHVDRLFHAVLPDFAANRFGVDRKAIVVIQRKIRSLDPEVDISEFMDAVDDLLDRSVSPVGYVIKTELTPFSETDRPDDAIQDGQFVDLSRIDFEALKKRFENSRKRIEAEKLRGAINSKLRTMVRLNKSRMDYYERLQQLIDEYNAGAKNVDVFFAQLVTLAEDLTEEERRGIVESLTEEQLAVFDLLTRPEIKLSRKEREQVKAVARDLLDTLKAERLVLDWRKQQKTRARVRLAIEEQLDKLPPTFDKRLYDQKCDLVYQHVYDSYYGEGKSVYVVVS